MSQSGSYGLGGGGAGTVTTLTGNSGGAVSPTLGNINVVGDTTTITVVGNPGTSTLTISAIGTGVEAWEVITLDQTAAVNTGYICNKGTTLALALPATATIGDILEVTGINNATGWQITQAAGQQIFFGTSSTTLGAGGSLTSSATRDAIRMVCVVADTTWQVLSSVGNITIV